MFINTDAAIQNGFYGKIIQNRKGSFFKSIGRAVTLENIFESIENEDIYLKLSTLYLGKQKTKIILRGRLTDPAIGKELADIGVDVTRRDFDTLVDTIRLQEEDFDYNNIAPTPAFSSLGWIKVPEYDDDGRMIDFSLYYRSQNLIGSSENAKYLGKFDITAVGNYLTWKNMVTTDVISFPVLQVTLIAALSAVVVGILALSIPIENPIIHLCLASGKGKSTAGYLAASTIGRPFDGTVTALDEDGLPVEKNSVYQSWGATDNAMITTQAGNRGVVTVLNELGKSLTKNMTRLIFDLSEGSDKKRLTGSLETRVSSGYSTTFISTGESSLLEKCDSKLEGLSVRVMEIDKSITANAEHANRIKDICSTHCGHAAPMLAQYILDHGGIDYVVPQYKAWIEKLRAEMPPSPNGERFVEKFSALFMLTADLATDALDIPFDKEGLYNFLLDYDRENGSLRDTAASSYDIILEKCRINLHRFNSKKAETNFNPDALERASQECWGRVCEKNELWPDGRVVVQEFEIRRSVLEGLLKENGFDNKSTCLAAWKKDGVLNFEDETHPCRYRKIDPSSPKEKVYVLRVFADEESATQVRKRASKVASCKPLRSKLTQKRLLEEDEEIE